MEIRNPIMVLQIKNLNIFLIHFIIEFYFHPDIAKCQLSINESNLKGFTSSLDRISVNLLLLHYKEMLM